MVEEAAWLTRLKEGEPGGMDEFLVSIGLGLRQMAGLPDPNELLADAPYDYRRAKEVRSDRGRARRGAQARRNMPENSGHGEVVQDASHEDSASDEPRLGKVPPQTATGRDGRTLDPPLTLVQEPLSHHKQPPEGAEGPSSPLGLVQEHERP